MVGNSKNAGKNAETVRDSLTPAQREAARSQQPTPEQLREGLAPDELNSTNDK